MGYEPRIEPLKINLPFCPSVKLSCCSHTDLKVIYENWVFMEEKKLLKERMDFHLDAYKKLNS